jgi:predicted GNAT family N-acyltransferase
VEIQKVFAHDFEPVYELIKKYDSVRSKQFYQNLFVKHWQTEEDFFGFMIIENGKVIAYLGLIFSKREIDNNTFPFVNLTSFFIDENYRGQKLTHKIIQQVKQLGHYTITAITPIPSLYNMYASNGFKVQNDFRRAFWKKLTGNKSIQNFITDINKIENLLAGEQQKVFNDHRQFNCLHAVLETEYENVYVILKERKYQLRRFFDFRPLNYTDALLKKLTGKNFMSREISCYEVLYCSNYDLLCKKFEAFRQNFFASVKCDVVALHEDIYQTYSKNLSFASKYYHSRQMFFSNQLTAQDIDSLYSEIFVLDM